MTDTNPNIHTFTISCDGTMTGEQYRGTFKIKVKLSHRDNLKLDAFRRELLGPSPAGQAPSQEAINMADTFSKIWTHLVDTPDWWKSQGNGLDIEDVEPVMAVLENIHKQETEIYKAIKDRAEKAKKDLVAVPT